MNGTKVVAGCVLVLAGILGFGAPAQAQDPPGTDPPIVEPSYDLFTSPEGLNSKQSFVHCPIPGIFFEESSDPPLTGCNTFNGTVHLRGVPLETFLGYDVGDIDTAVFRLDALDFGSPVGDTTVFTDIELVALSLGSAEAIKVKCDQGFTNWAVNVEVNDETGPSTGEMAVTLEYPEMIGGTVNSVIDVCPRVTFSRADPNTSGSFDVDVCTVGCEFQLVGDTVWSFNAPEGASILRIEGVTAEWFYFTEPLSAEEQLLVQAAADNDECCECVFKYPHLSADHEHQSCLPCPCETDQVPPVVEPPAEATMECTSEKGWKDGDDCIIPEDHPEFVCIEDWIEGVRCDGQGPMGPIECEEEPGELMYCGLLGGQSPDFLWASCDGYPNTIWFEGKDCCCNITTEPGVLRVKDTIGPILCDCGCPEIVNGYFRQDCGCPKPPGDLDCDRCVANACHHLCIWPPNHKYVCFDKSEFNPTIVDTCFPNEELDWEFVDCTIIDPGQGSGNTNNDCVVYPDSFCVRAERNGSGDGRTYQLWGRARDKCEDNWGPNGLVAEVRVEHDGEDCIEPPPPPCLWPPNHKYYCFNKAEYVDKVAQECPDTPDDWTFVGCPHNQPFDCNGNPPKDCDGDCAIRSNGDEICLRSERDGGSSRYYDLVISDPDCLANGVIDTIEVPANMSEHPVCREPDEKCPCDDPLNQCVWPCHQP